MPPASYMGSGDPNSSPCAFMTSALTTEFLQSELWTLLHETDYTILNSNASLIAHEPWIKIGGRLFWLLLPKGFLKVWDFQLNPERAAFDRLGWPNTLSYFLSFLLHFPFPTPSPFSFSSSSPPFPQKPGGGEGDRLYGNTHLQGTGQEWTWCV